jgi:hypothetical protein
MLFIALLKLAGPEWFVDNPPTTGRVCRQTDHIDKKGAGCQAGLIFSFYSRYLCHRISALHRQATYADDFLSVRPSTGLFLSSKPPARLRFARWSFR